MNGFQVDSFRALCLLANYCIGHQDTVGNRVIANTPKSIEEFAECVNGSVIPKNLNNTGIALKDLRVYRQFITGTIEEDCMSLLGTENWDYLTSYKMSGGYQVMQLLDPFKLDYICGKVYTANTSHSLGITLGHFVFVCSTISDRQDYKDADKFMKLHLKDDNIEETLFGEGAGNGVLDYDETDFIRFMKWYKKKIGGV